MNKKELEAEAVTLRSRVISLMESVSLLERKNAVLYERLYTNVERVYATRIDCSIAQVAPA